MAQRPPLLHAAQVDKMVMINGDGETGAAKVTAEVARVMCVMIVMRL